MPVVFVNHSMETFTPVHMKKRLIYLLEFWIMFTTKHCGLIGLFENKEYMCNSFQTFCTLKYYAAKLKCKSFFPDRAICWTKFKFIQHVSLEDVVYRVYNLNAHAYTRFCFVPVIYTCRQVL